MTFLAVCGTKRVSRHRKPLWVTHPLCRTARKNPDPPNNRRPEASQWQPKSSTRILRASTNLQKVEQESRACGCRKSSTLAPSSRFSKSAFTGTRVPLKSHHSTDFLRSALYNRTLVPIKHRWTITAPVQRNKDLNQTFFGFEGAGVSK